VENYTFHHGGMDLHLTTKNPPSKPPKIAIPAKKIACQIARINAYDDCKLYKEDSIRTIRFN